MNFLVKYQKSIWILGLLLYLSVAILNVGIIASDDYEFGISRIVPAQNWSVAKITEASGIRNPLQAIFLFTFTKTAYELGVSEPIWQLRFALCVVALMTYILNTYFIQLLFSRMGRPKDAVIPQFLMAFFFLCPLLFTRPLIETLASPFVTGSVVLAALYSQSGKYRELAAALGLLAVGSVFRYQVGVLAPMIALLPVVKKDFRGVGIALACGAILYVVTGVFDWLYKGGLHSSLFSYTRYQLSEISKFGKQPWYVFIALFVGISFPPVLFSKYRDFKWREEYRGFFPVLLCFVFFVFTHSLVTHKEERFMVPILPLFMILVTPMILYLVHQPSQAWRFRFFLILNFLLLPFASYNVPQNNLIGAARFIQNQPQVESVVDVGETLFNFPKAFIARGMVVPSLPASELLNQSKANGCGILYALRSDVTEQIPGLTDRFTKVAEFHPGILEKLVIKLNPRQNKRRGPIELYTANQCYSAWNRAAHVEGT